jgi:hypothetical protein
MAVHERSLVLLNKQLAKQQEHLGPRHACFRS